MWQDSTGNLVGLAHGNKGDHLQLSSKKSLKQKKLCKALSNFLDSVFLSENCRELFSPHSKLFLFRTNVLCELPTISILTAVYSLCVSPRFIEKNFYVIEVIYNHKHWIVEDNKIPAWARQGLATWMSSAFVAVSYRLFNLNLKLSSEKLSHFSNIWRTCGTIMYLLNPKRGGSERSVGLFYCLILSGPLILLFITSSCGSQPQERSAF